MWMWLWYTPFPMAKEEKKNVRPPRTFLFITFLLHACYVTAVLSALCNPVDCSPPGSSVHGISQARILQWVVISFSRAPSWPLTFLPRQEYCSGLSFPSPGDLPGPWPSFPGKNTAVGCHFLSRGPSWPSWSNLRLLSLVHWQAGSVALAPPGKSLLVQLAVMYLPSAHQVTLWARYWLTIYEVSADCVAWSQVERKKVYPHLRPAHFP